MSTPALAGATQLAGVTTGTTFDSTDFSPTSTPNVYVKGASLWGLSGSLTVKTCGSTVSVVTFTPQVGPYDGIDTAKTIVATQVAAGWLSTVVLEPGTGVYPVSSTAGIWHLTAGSSKLVVSGDTDSVVVSAFGPDC